MDNSGVNRHKAAAVGRRCRMKSRNVSDDETVSATTYLAFRITFKTSEKRGNDTFKSSTRLSTDLATQSCGGQLPPPTLSISVHPSLMWCGLTYLTLYSEAFTMPAERSALRPVAKSWDDLTNPLS